jgi:hypothetical protein
VTDYVHEASVDLADGADPRALGGAITAALCGSWEHEPPCRWPHHTDIASTDGHQVVTTVFTAEPDDEAAVRGKIVDALRSGSLIGPDDRQTRWSMREGPDA